MHPVTNPYTPNAGAEPVVVAGRSDLLEAFDILLARMAKGRTNQSMIVTGLRGVGKTVLLGQFRRATLAREWVVAELEVTKNDENQFRRVLASRLRQALHELSPKARWTDRFRHAAGVLGSFTMRVDAQGVWTAGIDVEPASGFADHDDLGMDVTDVLVAMGEAAQERGKGVVLLFDEVQFLTKAQLEALIQGLHKVVQRALPVTFVGAGLPQIAELAGDAKSYAERLFHFPLIGHLGDADAKAALRGPAEDEGAHFDEEALTLALSVTGSYPYFLQELGYAVWGVAAGPAITRPDVEAALPLYQAKLDESFFKVRLDRVTTLQKAYLRAMAELGPEPQKAADVASVMGRTSQNLAPTRAELINMGLLYTPDHGYAAFTVPHFDGFLKRAIPELVVPPLRERKDNAPRSDQ